MEVAVDEETFELSLDPVLGAASEARRATRRWLADSTMSDALLDDLQLVISELVTNAVVHARTPLRLLVRFDGAPGGDRGLRRRRPPTNAGRIR